jgi:hypothetical protein
MPSARVRDETQTSRLRFRLTEFITYMLLKAQIKGEGCTPQEFCASAACSIYEQDLQL